MNGSSMSTQRLFPYEVITEGGLGHLLFASGPEDARRKFKNEFYGERIKVVRRVRGDTQRG